MSELILRSYTELLTLPSRQERYEYLKLDGRVGTETFGIDRWINQQFYRDKNLWKRIRDQVIVRDNGCDMGLSGWDIYGKVIVHHMNPIRKEDFENDLSSILNPEYLICVSHQTHLSIHYGDVYNPFTEAERSDRDTCLWKPINFDKWR